MGAEGNQQIVNPLDFGTQGLGSQFLQEELLLHGDIRVSDKRRKKAVSFMKGREKKKKQEAYFGLRVTLPTSSSLRSSMACSSLISRLIVSSKVIVELGSENEGGIDCDRDSIG